MGETEGEAEEDLGRDVDEGPPPRDGDGMWNVVKGDRAGRFIFRLKESSCVLREEFSGKWASALGERTFDSGVHYFAVRINSHSNGPVQVNQLAGGWMVGVGEKNFPMDVDIQAGGEAFNSQPLTLGTELGDQRKGALWAAMFSNHSEGTPGSIVVQPPTLAVGAHGRRALQHDAQVFDGDVIGVRADVDHGEVSFYVNGTFAKRVKVGVLGGGWVAVTASCTSRVKFTMLREPEHSRLWSDADWQQILEGREAVGDSSGGEQRVQQEQQLAEALVEGRADEVDNLMLRGAQLPEAVVEQLTLPEVVKARDTLLRALARIAPEQEGSLRAHTVHCTHNLFFALQDARGTTAEARAESEEATAALLAAIADENRARTSSEQLSGSMDVLRTAGGADLGVALELEAEARRLAAELQRCGLTRHRAEDDVAEAGKAWSKADAARRKLQLMLDSTVARKDATAFRTYAKLVEHIKAHTAKRPTFSAPDEPTAATRRSKIKLGETWEPHEAIAAAMEPKSGELTVIVASATADTRIYYTVDGTKPVPSTRCPSVHNGGKIRLSSTAVIRAIAFSAAHQPSEVAVSPEFVVRCAPPQFISSGKLTGEEGDPNAVIRVMLKSVTPHAKVYYTFNSRDSTPEEFAVEGGQPIKEPPFGTGRGSRDGSRPLLSDAGSPRPDPRAAGCVDNHDFVDVCTSGVLTAFAAKDGLSDSVLAQSQLFTVPYK